MNKSTAVWVAAIGLGMVVVGAWGWHDFPCQEEVERAASAVVIFGVFAGVVSLWTLDT